MDIRVRYESIDRCNIRRKFKSLKGAQTFAQKYVGKHPEMGSWYAVSGDGVGKITVEGCTLAELFPAEPVAPPVRRDRVEGCEICDSAGDSLCPSHDASSSCESGKRSHCSCDTCF